MSRLLSDKEVHDYMERISSQGCDSVNQLLSDYDMGITSSEINHLTVEQREQVIVELRKVMSVYTSCNKGP